MRANQNGQRHEYGAKYPDAIGATSGPQVVAVMNNAIERPLAIGVLYKSANWPPVTEIGEEAKTPMKSRKTMKLAKLGEKHVARVKIVKPAKVPSVIICLP